MKFTTRSLIEFLVGMALVISAVFMLFTSRRFGAWTDLVLSIMSLGGILITAHAIWLMRQNE